jgi:hypothetical protein
MSKRLQVLFDEAEYRQLQRLAQRKGVSVAEWVRHAIRAAAREQPAKNPDTKLEAVRSAARHRFPTADIDRMLAEIEQGYTSSEAE